MAHWTDMSIDARQAFDYAIKTRVLSDNSERANYAGNYMFMGKEGRELLFKHVSTRRYIRVPDERDE